jgi:hypothetical protein
VAADNLGLVSTGVLQGLQADMPARSKISIINWRCER